MGGGAGSALGFKGSTTALHADIVAGLCLHVGMTQAVEHVQWSSSRCQERQSLPPALTQATWMRMPATGLPASSAPCVAACRWGGRGRVGASGIETSEIETSEIGDRTDQGCATETAHGVHS